MTSYNAIVYKSEIAYVAFSPELGVYSQGRTKQTALKNLQEAIELYLEDPDVKKSLKKASYTKPLLATVRVTA